MNVSEVVKMAEAYALKLGNLGFMSMAQLHHTTKAFCRNTNLTHQSDLNSRYCGIWADIARCQELFLVHLEGWQLKKKSK